jgi:hypothetical protein
MLTLLGLASNCDPPTSASLVAGVTGVYHHARLDCFFLYICTDDKA